MLKIPTFDTFADAYGAVLEHVGGDYEHVIAPRGNSSRECLNVSFALTDPRDRIVYNRARRTNIVFCYAEALWYLWGRDDLAMIGYYAPRLAAFAGKGRLTGTAYGPKLFGRQMPGWASQWEQLTTLLLAEPATKRAVATFFHPVELEEIDNPDVSCTIALQFLLRDSRLHAVVYMRANDAVIGLASDVFSFTLVQEFAAHQLSAELGCYAHHVGSMHINDVDQARATAIVAAGTEAEARPPFPVTVMPPTGWPDLKIIESYEAALRYDQERVRPDDLGTLGVAPYWQQVVLLFDVYRQIVHYPDTPVMPATLEALEPGYRWLIAHRWPGRLPEGFIPPTGAPR